MRTDVPSNPRERSASLRRRSLRAGAWVGGGHVVGQVTRLIGNLILARLLMPDAFGIMAVISTLMMALNLISDIGAGTVIVQSHRGAERAFLHTAWTLQIIRGLALWMLGLVVAATVALGQSWGWFVAGTVYADPQLPPMIAVATFGLAIIGFGSVNNKLAERNLDLRKLSLVDIAAGLGSLVVTVGLALWTASVWALVVGGLVTSLLKCVLSHLLLEGPRPALRLEPEAFRELISKGKWILLTTLMGFIATNGDRLLLGGLADSTSFGLYSIAFGLATLGSTVLNMVMMRVVYPAVSEVVRERRADLPRTYRKFQQLIDVSLGLLAGAMFMASETIIDLLYDDRYQGAGHIFAVLAIGSLGARMFLVELVYTAMGRNSLVAASMLPRVVVLLVGLPLGFAHYQLDGALTAIVLSQFAHWPIALWFRYKEGLTSLWNDACLPVALVAGGAVGWLLDKALAWVLY
ncbi:oligosaccharide flippase family protein [uncultured Methylibium sp.]|uniref:oligosaccharide flippase family protein n=1 Tax=uncultured Methylibium sp. TaxID=381093 RepID=UPI0025E0A91C|nr:oligosaccharide flippase family protein [uncultured Methylibium sp.]